MLSLNHTRLLKKPFAILLVLALAACAHKNMKNSEVHDKAMHVNEAGAFRTELDGQKLIVKGCLYSDFGRLGDAYPPAQSHVYLRQRISWDREKLNRFWQDRNVEKSNRQKGPIAPILVRLKKPSRFITKKSDKTIRLKDKKLSRDEGLYVVLEGVFEDKVTSLFYHGIGDDTYQSSLSEASIVYFDKRDCRGWYSSETGELIYEFGTTFSDD